MKGTVALGGFRKHRGSASIKMIGPNGDVIWSATSGDKDSVKDLAHNLVKQLKRDLRNPGYDEITVRAKPDPRAH